MSDGMTGVEEGKSNYTGRAGGISVDAAKSSAVSVTSVDNTQREE